MGLTDPARTGSTHSLSHQQEVKYPFGKKGTLFFEVLPRDKKKKKISSRTVTLTTESPDSDKLRGRTLSIKCP